MSATKKPEVASEIAAVLNETPTALETREGAVATFREKQGVSDDVAVIVELLDQEQVTD